MKSVAELKLKLRRQWEAAANRESRLLGAANAWPVIVSIGRPAASRMTSDLDAVKHHVDQWRRVSVGEVVWETINYRATSSAVQLPVQWKLRQPTEWINACADRVMRSEFEVMTAFAERTDPLFHSLLIRQRSLWRGKALNEVVRATRLALALAPGCAEGKPLRTLSLRASTQSSSNAMHAWLRCCSTHVTTARSVESVSNRFSVPSRKATTGCS